MVRAGNFGGWVQREENLSHKGTCWIGGNAVAYGYAHIGGNAIVNGKAIVDDHAIVGGNSLISDDALITDTARIDGYARICNMACVKGSARVRGNSWVTCLAQVDGGACIEGNAYITDRAQITGHVTVNGDSWVYGNAFVSGCGCISGVARVGFDYKENFTLKDTDGFIFKDSWFNYENFFYNRFTKMWSVGAFLGTSEELLKWAYKESKKSGCMYEKYVKFAEALAAEEEAKR